MNRWLAFAAATLFAAFAVIVYGHVFSDGLCCADDSANAIVAKNLALGYGYTNSISYDGTSGLKRFDAGTSTGPTLNVPAAFLVGLFGNVLWAPGFTAATAGLTLLLCIWWLVAKFAGTGPSTAYTCTLLLFLYVATAGIQFEQWYSLIGEIPAALCCVLGAAVLAQSTERRTAISVGCLLYGLAVLTKMLALLSVAPVALWLIWRCVGAPSARRQRAGDAVVAATALAAPLLLFHSWQILALGGCGYVATLNDFWAFVTQLSVGAINPGQAPSFLVSVVTNVTSHASLLELRHGTPALGLLSVAIGAAGLFYAAVRDRRLRLLFLLLSGGAATHLSWWLIVSDGRPRYALIGLCIYLAALSCAVFIRPSALAIGVVLPLLVVAIAASYPKNIQPIKFVRRYQFAHTPRVTNLIRTAEFLSTLDASRPFVTGWWATAGDIEYALPTVGNFVSSDRVDPRAAQGALILVRNKRWVAWATTPEFTVWESRCDEVLLDAPPYLVTRCPVAR